MKAGGAEAGGRGSSSGTFAVRVLPRSSREGVAGFSEGAIRVRLNAPPVDNRANEALVDFLSRILDVPRREIEIVAGRTGRNKIVRITGMAREAIFRKLGLQQPPD